MKVSRPAVVLAVLVVGVVAWGIYAWLGRQPDPPLQVRPKVAGDGSADAHREVDPARVLGDRPRDAKKKQASKDRDRTATGGIGRTQPIPPDLNPQVKSVVEAIRTGKHPERLFPMIQGKPFDPAAFKADPQAYLDVAEPGRVFQSAQPGPDVSGIIRRSPNYREIEQGESVELRVEVPPGAPVTFTNFDLGEFPNRLTTITVQADAKGIAKTIYKGTPGMWGDADILASSPLTSGQLAFVVNVKLATVGSAVESGRTESNKVESNE